MNGILSRDVDSLPTEQRFDDGPAHAGCMLSPDQTRELPVTYRKLGFRRTRWMPLDRSMLSSFTGPRCDAAWGSPPPS